MSFSVGFVMDQIAGHVTNYRNLRRAADTVRDMRPDWHEIHYRIEGGLFERVHDTVPFFPGYVAGVSRGSWEVHKALRNHRNDVLYSNASVGVFFSGLFRRTPTLIDFDSTPMQIDLMPAYGGTPDPVPLAKFKWTLTKRMYESASVLQVWSNWAKRSVVNDYGIAPEKIVINPPGVDLDFWREALVRRERPAGRPLQVLFVGGDFRRKGGDLLLEWYRNQRPEQVELHIVTREPVTSMPGVFVYHDVSPNSPTLIQRYREADLFVLPSLGECFGIATVEAMAAGLPVIASDVGGTADIIVPGRNGQIVAGNNLAALSAAIGQILGDTSLRLSMGEQSRALAEDRFNLYTNAQRTFELLRTLAERPHIAAPHPARSI